MRIVEVDRRQDLPSVHVSAQLMSTLFPFPYLLTSAASSSFSHAHTTRRKLSQACGLERCAVSASERVMRRRHPSCLPPTLG